MKRKRVTLEEKIMKNKTWLVIIIALIITGLSGCGSSYANQETTKKKEEATMNDTDISDMPETKELDMNWREGYKAILNDWTLIEEYGDFVYLKTYFGEDYGFDAYWLCDIDGNGTPELFLYSKKTEMTVVFTYTEKPVFLLYEYLYGINPETAELVIHGHWHGAGGSGINEWAAYKVSGDTAEYSMYIDLFDTSATGGEADSYTIYNPQTNEYQNMSSGLKYDELYSIHVTPCITIDGYNRYELSDLSGLDIMQ